LYTSRYAVLILIRILSGASTCGANVDHCPTKSSDTYQSTHKATNQRLTYHVKLQIDTPFEYRTEGYPSRGLMASMIEKAAQVALQFHIEHQRRSPTDRKGPSATPDTTSQVSGSPCGDENLAVKLGRPGGDITFVEISVGAFRRQQNQLVVKAVMPPENFMRALEQHGLRERACEPFRDDPLWLYKARYLQNSLYLLTHPSTQRCESPNRLLE
jgi:hypothetical protein